MNTNLFCNKPTRDRGRSSIFLFLKKKLLLIGFLISVSPHIEAQVFSTAQVHRPWEFSLGIAPTYFNDHLGVFIFGDVGLRSGVDFGLRYGALYGDNYFGADFEWALLEKKIIFLSLTTGCHIYHDIGLDLSANLSFRVKSDIQFYTGFDMDVNLGNSLMVPFWLPVGLKIDLTRHVSFLFEAELPLNHLAYPIIGGGIMFSLSKSGTVP